MGIIGWIRRGDKAACGGTVIEGDVTCTSHGQPYAFQGARMACQKNCLIADGFIRSTLTNGRAQVIHGMITTGNCPLKSTLNNIDGLGNESEESIATEYFLNSSGEWTAIKEPQPHDDPFDEQAKLNSPPIEGLPYYIETLDGRSFAGRTGADGLLPRIDTYGEDEYLAYWGDKALAKMKDGQAHG